MIKAIYIILTIVLIIVLFYIIRFWISIDEKRLVEIVYNSKFDERIYFTKLSWGNDEMIVISKKKYKSGSMGKYNFILNCGCCILYRLKNDTLFLYGNNIEIPKENKFKTPIKVYFMGNSDPKYNTYKMEGLKIFPPVDK